ncbi:hypothetical protein TI05_03285 [Achromatium sp. WMS3]|nr:hypothetical protein TI05_03285 [Achromatium sp. WMS3]
MRYRNLITTTILGLALTCAYAVTAQAAAPAHCVVTIGDSCQKIKPPGEKQGKHNEPSRGPITDADIKIEYKYSKPDGIGQDQELKNGDTLRTGDRFTIHVTVNRDLYLYLYHFDATGTVTEVLSYSGKGNHFKTGDNFILPSSDENFELDDNIGTETIHAIASLSPQLNLVRLYKDHTKKLKRKVRGFNSKPNHPSPTGCLGTGACRGTMVFQHVEAEKE